MTSTWTPGLHKVSHCSWDTFHTMLILDADTDASAHGAPTLPDGKMHPFFHGNRLDQLHRHLDVVARHHHLHPLRQLDRPRHIGGADVELRPVAIEERRMPAALFLG